MGLLPKKVFEQHVVVLGKTGSGKSSALRVLIEELLDDKQPVCVIDPKGDWWGLKLSASGKSAGYAVVIFGGQYADVPINPHSGGHVAELIATGNRPCIIDLGGWMVSDRTRFFIDFASTLFRTTRGHRYLLIDEVHNFAPQYGATGGSRGIGGEAPKMLHWANRLASEGRGKGLTILSASQRPQKVHKDFLTCAETLIAMRVIHKLDRDAIKDWIDGAGDPAKGREVLDTLASSERGQAWVWSPEIGFGPKRVKFPMFATYDSFAPKANSGTATLKGWASVDLEEVKTKLAAVVEEAKANDPAELKKRIRELERASKSTTSTVAFTEEYLNDIRARAAKERDKFWQGEVSKITKAHGVAIGKLQKIAQLAALNGEATLHVQTPPAMAAPPPSRQAVPRPIPARREVPETAGELRLGGGALRMVQVLADRYPAKFTEAQWATMSGLKRTGGTWSTYKSRIVQTGLVVEQGGYWTATDEAVAQFGDASRAPQSPEELLLDWKQKLGGGPARMLDALWAEPMTREQLADAISVEVTGGTFGTYLSRLRSNGLITESGGVLSLSEAFA